MIYYSYIPARLLHATFQLSIVLLNTSSYLNMLESDTEKTLYITCISWMQPLNVVVFILGPSRVMHLTVQYLFMDIVIPKSTKECFSLCEMKMLSHTITITMTKAVFFVLFSIFPLFTGRMATAENTTIPVKVGVILDLNTSDGKKEVSCINISLSNFYASHGLHYKTRLLLNIRDSESDVVGAAAAALDLINNVEVQAIIGPDSSMQASFVSNVGEKAQVPIVTYSATSPTLSWLGNDYFIQAAQYDSAQVKLISAIVQAFGWTKVVPIYEGGEFGGGIISYLTDALQEVGTRVSYLSVIHPGSSDDEIKLELYQLMRMQTRVFIIHMLPTLGSRIFKKAKEIGMLKEGYVWIMTNGMTNQLSSIDLAVRMESMQGVLGIKTYFPHTEEIEKFTSQWKRKFTTENPAAVDAELDIFGLWAHDAAVALAMAIEEAGTANLVFQKTNVSGGMDLQIQGVSANGPKLVEVFSRLNFRGLAGDFHLVNEQLQSSVFEVLNIYGNGWKGIGYWTPTSGLVKELSLGSRSSYSTSKDNLGPIMWPGDTTFAPKGWESTPLGRTLKIGVSSSSNNFSGFVKAIYDPVTNTPYVTGYCIDVFREVIQRLPYAVSYDFVPFLGTHDDLTHQVFLRNFDGAAGDVTILAKRALYVDFTLPFTENTLTMIVSSVKDMKKQSSAWDFLKPLTWDLWVTSACFFAFIGFVVWVLEHRINQDFRGPPSQQIGTSFWFSLSTMIFAQRERVMSNLGRVVVIIWCFVVLILTQSYTASWTSLITVGQLKPPITDIKELIIREEYIGYRRNSYVSSVLKGLGFHESRLRPYSSPEECDELFSKGSENGGIVAAFDEAPYMKLIAAKYCSKYTMIPQMSLSNGFGFVFPKGSSLVLDFSTEIMNIIEQGKLAEIEREWFGHTSCSRPSTSDPPISLGLDCFWGLFLIAGVAAAMALIIFLAMFIYEHRRVLMSSETDPEASVWTRIVTLGKYFDQKDQSSWTFRENSVQETSGNLASTHLNQTETSPSIYLT